MKASFFRQLVAFSLLLSVLICLCACRSKEEVILKEGTDTVTLCAVGDIYLTEEISKDCRVGTGSYNFQPLLSQIVHTISRADIAMGNLEGLFSTSEEGSLPDSFAEALAQTGFDILQTANTYSVHNGISGLSRTKSIIESNGMSALGTYASAEERKSQEVLIKEVNGIRLAFIAFTKGFNGFGLPADSEYCTTVLYKDYSTNYEKINEAAIKNLVNAAAAQNPDFIIAGLHWGSENISGISKTQESITDLLLSNGVDVILGSHSHRVEEVERRTVRTSDGGSKECVIAYGLGDFCATSPEQTTTAIALNLEFFKDHATGEHHISSLSYTPISTVYQAEGNDHYSVVVSEEALSQYEANYYLRIEQTAYEAICKSLEKLDKTIFPPEEDD